MIDKAEIVGERILDFIKENSVNSPEGMIKLKASIGICCIKSHDITNNEIPKPVPQEYFENTAKEFIKCTDQMLYKAKKNIEKKICIDNLLAWKSFK